ncbi:hypothetical protein [Mesorhizobium xinjiangense]|uniref:hypothetical protein n=1 Tax=Mesorhizobium xinjiangense TaxID=2678685 RepID=UPI0018DCE716|nr:hypothetical protein [Mesorhizobium xinjiangense]
MSNQTADRFSRLRAAMKAHGADLVALAPGSHMDWLVGFHPHPSPPSSACSTRRSSASSN